MPFLHPDTPDPARLGGKGAALARLGEMGFEIPAWFAVAGTGGKLVSGEVDGETWRIGRSRGILEKPDGPLLAEADALAVAGLARRCESACGRPQDVEWAIDAAGKLWLLQSRPITSLGQTPDPDDELRVWDNSNIAESYGGVTTPLTFSFARQTDPGWVVLFPAAAGLLVERGSLLSHSAIVSRELRLPCIVSLPGISGTLKTGDLVEMDGAAGTVRILENKEERTPIRSSP